MRYRLLLPLLLAATPALVAAPALAADWKPYANPRFGYVIDLPADFRTVSEADNGDGITLHSRDDKAELLVFGSNVTEGTLGDDVANQKQSYSGDGWKITYERSGKDWISYSGTRKDRILYVRAVSLCGGAGGYFTLEYPKAQAKFYDPIVSHLVKTLSGPPHCG